MGGSGSSPSLTRANYIVVNRRMENGVGCASGVTLEVLVHIVKRGS